MAKAKNNLVHLPLVATGYILFILLVVATLLSTTIPLGAMLFDSRVLHFNVAVSAVALTIGSILPVLLGYIIGSHAIKSKGALSHHFNGILFGLLGYWLMTVLAMLVIVPEGLFTDFRTRILLLNLLPGILVAILTTILAVAHVRSRQAKQDVLEYKPFSAILIASIVALPVWSLVNNIVTNTVGMYSFISLAIVIVLGAVSYASLRKTRLSSHRKVLWSAVSVSVIFVMTYVSSQFVSAISSYLLPYPTMEAQSIVSGVGFALALAGWVIYWSKQVKVLK